MKLAYPEIPQDGWFTNWAMDIISGGDKELRDILTYKPTQDF
jgi:hypothetical protein